jgi:ABC-type transport system involved in multi-copper enzyme maturation permease subunit
VNDTRTETAGASGTIPSGAPRATGKPWGLWRRQALAVCRLELKRNVLGRRIVPVYILATLPVVLFALRFLAMSLITGGERSLGFAADLYGAVFQTFMLRFVFYFGCVWVFMNLLRGEILDRSLHYYFLAPVRRDVLLAGKYLAGVIMTGLAFTASTLAAYVFLYLPHDPAGVSGAFFHGPALRYLFDYLLVVVLACVGYGAVFLLMGALFKNPVIPAVAILVWEWSIFLLPPVLKKVSIAYYLQSLCPTQFNNGPIQILAEPSPPIIAIPGIVLVSVGLLVLAALRTRRMEISYSME